MSGARKRKEQKEAAQLQRDFSRTLEPWQRLHVLDRQGILDAAHQQQKRQLERQLDRFLRAQEEAGVDVQEFQQRRQAILRMPIPPVDPQALEYFRKHGKTPARNQFLSTATALPDAPAAKRARWSEGDREYLDLGSVPMPDGPAPPSAYEDPPIDIPIAYNLKLAKPMPVETPEESPVIAVEEQPEAEPRIPEETAPPPAVTIISAQPKLRDLQKEVTTMLPAAVRRRTLHVPRLPAPTLGPDVPQASAEPATISSVTNTVVRRFVAAPENEESDSDDSNVGASLSDRLRLGILPPSLVRPPTAQKPAPSTDATYQDFLNEVNELL